MPATMNAISQTGMEVRDTPKAAQASSGAAKIGMRSRNMATWRCKPLQSGTARLRLTAQKMIGVVIYVL
jgi:hypothetical protein